MGLRMDVRDAGTFPSGDQVRAAPGPLILERAESDLRKPFSWLNPRDGNGISGGGEKERSKRLFHQPRPWMPKMTMPDRPTATQMKDCLGTMGRLDETLRPCSGDRAQIRAAGARNTLRSPSRETVEIVGKGRLIEPLVPLPDRGGEIPNQAHSSRDYVPSMCVRCSRLRESEKKRPSLA